MQSGQIMSRSAASALVVPMHQPTYMLAVCPSDLKLMGAEHAAS